MLEYPNRDLDVNPVKLIYFISTLSTARENEEGIVDKKSTNPDNFLVCCIVAISSVLTGDCCPTSVGFLDPLGSPLWWFEWISKVECFMCDFFINELHDAGYINWTSIISNNIFSYP